MDFDQTQAIYDYEEEEEEQVEQEKADPKKKEVGGLQPFPGDSKDKALDDRTMQLPSFRKLFQSIVSVIRHGHRDVMCKPPVAQLKVFSQQGFKETIFLVFQGDNIIGRDGKCNITIPIKALSKKHACIEVQRDLHLIYDCESKNRTKKGKSFLKPTIRYELKHGDMLTLGDVTCQYLVDLDAEEDEGDATGSETGSESMLPDATTEEELDADKPVVHEDVPNKTDAISDDLLLQPVQDCKLTNTTKDDDEAYAADTDSDTDEERPLAVAAMATVLYSSEDEQETPARQKAASVSYKRNTSMEGQTLAFGLGSPDNVFRNRDSSSSAASHSGQTASVPPTLMLSSESDIQSDGKADLSSDNKHSSPRHPGTRGSGTQPTCEPTLLYGAESDDGSPVKRPRHPGAMVSDKPDPSCDPTLLYGSESEDVSPIKKPRHPEARVSDRQDLPCDPTLLYGSESEDVSPIKKPRRPAASNVPTVLFESDSEEGTDKAQKDSDARKDNEQPLLFSEIPGSSPGEAAEKSTADKQEKAAAEEADATLPYAAAEMSSTDDEQESETNVDVEKPTAHTEPRQAYSTEDSGKEEDDGEDKYGEDTATQPYSADSNFESETIPFAHVDKSDANQPAKPLDLEATQAYCAADEEEDSDSSDSQPLPIGPTAVAAHDDLAATLAYGLEATQAYNVTEKDDEEDDEESGRHANDEPTLAYDLQATQAYGVGEGDDTDDEDDDKRERCIETVEGELPKTRTTVNRRDAIQATIPYGLEATQPYGADETDDEDSDDQEGVSRGGDQGRGDEPTLAYDLAATLPYGGGDDNDDDDDDGNENNDDGRDKKVAEAIVRQENQAMPAYGLEETQAYDDDNNDTDSAPYSAIEATQAYGIEEPSEAEVQPNKQTAKKHTTKRVAFASSSPESTEVAETDETEVDAFESVIPTDKKSKPSTSTDAEEDLQDSEDLIQPRLRARKGRKKPVIEESQEEESQQASGRKSPTEGKSKAANKPRKGRTQTETAGTSLTAGTTEQLEEACGTTEVETPVTTPASRRGRRVAMRVTIEPEEEEASQETSTRRRGRKAKEAGDQVESSKKDTSTAAGRKRGRKTAKTSVAESSEEVNVQVEETPAPKSRRGRKGKTEQTEAVSVSETPLKTATDITVVTEAIDSQTTTTTTIDVETPNVHRGGRRKGTKGASAKKTAQAVKEQDQEESIESEAVVEATPSRGKGRGKGRGKRTHSTNEPEAVKAQDQEQSIESEAVVEATPSRGKGRGKGRGKRTQSTNGQETKESVNPVSAIADEVQPQLTVASPAARGKGRGKGRGKKAQSVSTESEVSEMPAVNEEELQLPESPSVAVASKGKGRGRQGRGKRTQSSITELESSEDTSQTLSTPVSRKGRGRGKVSRESSEPGPSSDVEVTETPTKKSRRGKEPSVSHSPSLRQGKPAGESNPRVIFTGLVDKQGEKVVTSLGGELVDNIHNCTHLVTDKVRRTVKFLCGLTSGHIIVLPSWLDACKRAKSFVDTSPFLVKDKDAEKQYKFDLHRSHEVALRQGLLEGYKIHVTKKVKPEPSHMKDIIQSAKGEFLSSMPRGKDDKVFVISCEEDGSVCKKPLDAGIPVVSAEVLLTGVLRQQLDLEEHKLFVEEMSDTSQDTTSSSGQSKRMREPSETSASTSTAERRTSGSKRRKR